MEGFILEVNSSEVSKFVSCSISLMLTLTWGIDIFEKLTPEMGRLVLRTSFAHYVSGGDDFMQSLSSLSSLLISSVVIYTLMP